MHQYMQASATHVYRIYCYPQITMPKKHYNIKFHCNVGGYSFNDVSTLVNINCNFLCRTNMKCLLYSCANSEILVCLLTRCCVRGILDTARIYVPAYVEYLLILN